jgi:hypothetical protein
MPAQRRAASGQKRICQDAELPTVPVSRTLNGISLRSGMGLRGGMMGDGMMGGMRGVIF